MIKVFGKGLGQVDHPFSVSDPVQIQGSSTPVNVERDQNLFKTGLPTQGDSDPGLLRSTLQMPREDVSKEFVTETTFNNPAIGLRLNIRPKVFSAVSGQVPFETLFHDFNIEVFPFYNFWVPDELTNNRDARGERKLEDVPRFIKVTWDIAPDLPDPDHKIPKRVNKRTIKSIIFAQELQRPNVFRAKGVDFTPKHLQPEGLTSIKSAIANGHMAPGVLEAIVDLPLPSAGLVQPLPSIGIDEDVFLNDQNTRGISIHELRAQTLQVTNGTLAHSAIGRDGVSPSLGAAKAGLVDSQFNISKSPGFGGSMNIQGVQRSSPNISLSSKTATTDRKPPNDQAQSMLANFAQPAPFNDVPKTAQAKVKFFDPSIGALVSDVKVKLMTAPEHLEAMTAIAPSLPSLELLARSNYYTLPRAIKIPSLPSPRMKPLDYIGYVLEKYARGVTGVFTKVDEIDIPSREINEYYDTKVLYGETYRYRIRSILRWNRPSHQGVMGKDPTVAPRFASHAAKLAPNLSSYFYSEWSHTWAYGTCMDDQPPLPPDELQARPESHRKRVVVTFRLPENNQRDILSMRLFRKLQDSNGRDLTDWLPMVHSDGAVDHPPQNVIFFDTNVDFFQTSRYRYVYTAQCVSRHGEDSVLSEQLAVRLNQDYSTRGEYLVDSISSAGVRMEYFGAFSTIPAKESRSELVVSPPLAHRGSGPGSAALIVVGRNALGNMQGTNTNYLIRVQSLDTGESSDIPFSTLFRYLKTREIFKIKHVFALPAHPEKKNSIAVLNKPSRVLVQQLTKYQDPKALGSTENKILTLPHDRAMPLERYKR